MDLKISSLNKLTKVSFAGLFIFFLTGCSMIGVRGADEPNYQVKMSDGEFETRKYSSFVIAQTAVENASYESAGKIGFDRLFAYIQGANSSQSKIKMTAPVIANPTEVNESSPPTKTEGGDNGVKIDRGKQYAQKIDGAWHYAFVLPKKYNLENAPKPTDPNVTLVEVPERMVAVVRYSGSGDAQKMISQSLRLREWVKSNNLEIAQGPLSARYDPPWTIPALRRNEVMYVIN